MAEKQTRWWRRLTALAELHGDHTQQEIAETLGVSPAAVSGWRYGRPPRAETVVSAALIYGVDPTELLRLVFVESLPAASLDEAKARVAARSDDVTRQAFEAATSAVQVDRRNHGAKKR